MKNEVREHYELLLAVCREETLPLHLCYRRMRELLEHLCRTQMEDGSLQMTDLSARINFVASKAGLTVAEQNRLHTFRLTSNAVMNRRLVPQRESLLRDAKTLAFFIKRLTGEDIPAGLYRLLPRADATYRVEPPAKQRVKRMRVCFQYSDEAYLYVLPADSVTDEPLRVRRNLPGINEEFAETCRLLWRHAQLNLLDVAVDENGILTPSFIILEPDYLIDISSLAECFREYGHHPANYLLARLQSPDNARPLLLGNIANLFLDEWIHAKETPDYQACMKKAFRTYPIELAACADLNDKEKEAEFFADCKRHFENIRRTVTETFRAPGYELDRTDAVLEPSYICEALGLQGRLDYMQRDMSSFIEMKSGKADEYAIRGKIEPKENNRVQMLLYQAVLEYAMGMNHRQVKAYLFYTRYPLLYPARPSWAMLRRVMDVRNRIVAAEYAIQLHNSPHYTAERLKDINPDTLNERRLDNALWKRFLSPSIDAVARQIRSLSPLEQSYFYALYNFITKELYTSKSGDIDYEGRTGAASLWLSTLAEKSEAGEILFDLLIRENHAAAPHKPYLSLSLPSVTPAYSPAASPGVGGDDGLMPAVAPASSPAARLGVGRDDSLMPSVTPEPSSAASPGVGGDDGPMLAVTPASSPAASPGVGGNDGPMPAVTPEPSPEATSGTERDGFSVLSAPVLPNFRQGDAVVLYERNADTDNVANKMVFKGNIEYIADDEVRIRLRVTQQNAGVLPADSRYAIEHDHMDTSSRSMYLGLSSFLSATRRRRDLLLGQRTPEFDSSFSAEIAAAPDDFSRIILKARAARDYFLLVGPPGTGKTSRALRGMVEAFYKEGKQILLLSYTNRAVDEISKALSAIVPAIDFIRIGSEFSCAEAFRPHLMENVLETCVTRRQVRERIAGCHVFVGTVATLSVKTDLFRLKTFDVAIVDEATQILEPQLLGLLCARTPAGEDAIGKFIMIGDHKQLPAVVLQPSVQSEVRDEALRAIGLYNLKDSLFERLYRNLLQSSDAAPLSPGVGSPSLARSSGGAPHFDMLCRQGRMNVEVAAFPNRAFYGGLLQPVGLPHQQGKLALSPELCGNEFAPLLTRRVAFLPSEAESSGQSAKVNHSEARIVARLAAAVHRQYASSSGFDASATLGVITPYRSQIALIKKELAAMGIPSLNDILVDTVERFQGSERDVIIYSFCVNRAYQLRFLANMTEENGVPIDRKLNVALTRARKQMFITGVVPLLKLNPVYAKLLEAVGYE
ncbi:AAA domain-containing protein [Bacteroides zoogleoformans]|uniref:DEAD/DEAH box helicase n=1 Tax=Bacteroides zoogleoformans TaxID=28119 RepID=UPI0011AC9434|nr:AAA domain-containing protein [Bacteroides zoogleoformans]TWJ18118.1 AAA domain-containing protein [Bacteroides zoogleoformans]